MKNILRVFGYKTTWVGILGAIGYLLKQPHIDLPTLIDAATGAGLLASARDAAQTLAGKNVS